MLQSHYAKVSLLLLIAALPMGIASRCEGISPTPEALYMAVAEAPSALRLLQDVAAVPAAVAEVLRLPMGIMQLALSPLPLITVKDGLTNLGQGLLGPFKLAAAILKLPASAVATAGDILKLH